MPFDDVKRL